MKDEDLNIEEIKTQTTNSILLEGRNHENEDTITVTISENNEDCSMNKDKLNMNVHELLTGCSSNEDIFTTIYKNNVWGNCVVKSCCQYSGSSGKSSSLKYTNDYIKFMKRFIMNNECKSVIDLGCGDWQHSHKLYEGLHVQYTGYDIYHDMIEYLKKTYPLYTFKKLDIIQNKDKICGGDVCIIKDVFEYICNHDIDTLMKYIIGKKLFKYIFIITSNDQENDYQDIKTNGCYRKLSGKYYPLKAYNPVIIMKYKSKEVLLIATHQ